MARLATTELLQPFATAAYSAYSAVSWDVPLELISDAVNDLRRAGYDSSLETVDQVTAIAEAFALARSTAPFNGQPGREKQLLARLRDGGDVHVIFEAMAPEFMIELAKYLHPDDANWVLNPDRSPQNDVINRVRRAAAGFLMNYQPSVGPKPDVDLETAVRAFVELLTPVIGHPPKVSGNKSNGRGSPTPGCPGARVIEDLLRGIDPALYPSAVMNMVLKVHRQPEPTDDPLLDLFRANPINDLDASLLPGRHEAIAALRDDPINGFA